MQALPQKTQRASSTECNLQRFPWGGKHLNSLVAQESHIWQFWDFSHSAVLASFWKCSWMVPVPLFDNPLFCWALLSIRMRSKSRAPTSLGSAMLQPVMDSSGCDTFRLPIDAVLLSKKKYNIHREEERKQGAMSLFLNDDSTQAGMQTPGFWSPFQYATHDPASNRENEISFQRSDAVFRT